MSDLPSKTKEPQYQAVLDTVEKLGRAKFGLMSSQVYHDDPKRLTFLLSRYKFVSKMLTGKKRVAEVGCADAFGTPLVATEVGSVTAFDFDPLFIEDAETRLKHLPSISFKVHDVLSGPLPDGPFDATYACDVFEHIDPAHEDRFVSNLCSSLTEDGVLILGIPSLESQKYASPQSIEGHVNCKSGEQFRAVMLKHFKNVFLFSMNDEVVHTGYSPMAHYLFTVCVAPLQPGAR